MRLHPTHSRALYPPAIFGSVRFPARLAGVFGVRQTFDGARRHRSVVLSRNSGFPPLRAVIKSLQQGSEIRRERFTQEIGVVEVPP